ADDGLEALDLHARDDGKTFALTDMGEAFKQGVRQLAHGAEEAVVAGAGRQRAVIALQFLAVARLDKTHCDNFTAADPQHIGILLEILEPKRAHGSLPKGSERKEPAPLSGGGAGLAAYQARQKGLSASLTMSPRDRPTS